MPVRTLRFLVLPALAGAAFLLSFYQVTTYDVFWHLKTGEVILESGSLVETNYFSASHAGHPWPNPEWLFQVLLAFVHGVGGWEAVTLFKVALVLLIAGALYFSVVQRRVRPFTALCLTVVSLCGMQFRFTERPHLFSYLFISLLLIVVERHRRRGGRLIWVLPPLFALWSNFHPELIIGFLLVGAVATGDLIAGTLRGGAGKGIDTGLAAAALVSVPATLVNPEGWHVLAFPFHHTFLGPMILVEEYAPSSPLTAPVFWGFLLCLAVVLWLTRRDTDPADLIVAVGVAVLGILYLRATPYLFLAGSPILGAGLTRLGSSLGRDGARRLTLAAALAAALSLTWAFGFERLMPYQWGWGFDDRDFPVEAADLLATGRFPPILYNDYAFGGYLAYRLSPGMGVFQDGRVQAYPPEFIARLHSRFSFEDWPVLLSEYGVETALVQRAHLDALFNRREWGVVYWDDRWALLVRRSLENGNLLTGHEYRHFLPGADVGAVKGSEGLRLLAAEMERNQGERRSRSPYVDNNLGTVYRRLSLQSDAERALRRSIAGDGRYAPAWANLGALLVETGRGDEGRRALEKAVGLDPSLRRAADMILEKDGEGEK